MSANTKKRKLQHSANAAAAPAGKRGGQAEAEEDPRFQINSDFSDSDAELDAGAVTKAAAGSQHSDRPRSTPAGAGRAKQERQAADQRLGQESRQRAHGESSSDGEENGDGLHRDDDGGEGDGAAAAAANGGGRGTNGTAGEAAPASASVDEDEDEDEDVDYGTGAGGSGKGGSESGDADAEVQGMRKRKKVLSKRKLERVNEASDRRGIVYISRIPPHMKPHKLRQLLEPFGDIGRVYCAPEDPALRRMRKKKGGNSGKNFTEGWVEFEDKRRAKRAALALNGQPIGGSKRSAYHYDLWTIKYLPKFKWDTLTEEINYQRAVREQRLVAEISAAKRERDFYLSRVDKAKAIDAIQERRRAKQQQTGDGAAAAAAATTTAIVAAVEKPAVAAAGAGAASAGRGGPRFERHFGQRRAKADPVLDDRAPVLADDVLGLLGRKRKAQTQ